MTSSTQYIAYRFGSFVLDLERGALLAAEGKEIPLRPKSFTLLQLLVKNAGRLLSQEAIMEALWPNIFVTENSVTQCIHEIRGVLGSEAYQTLRTFPRRGYLFTSDVMAVPPASQSPQKNGIDESGSDGLMPHRAVKHGKDEQPVAEDKGVQSRLSPASVPHPSARHPQLKRLSIMVALSRSLDVRNEHPYPVEDIPQDISADLAHHPVSDVVYSPDAPHRYGGSAIPQVIAHEFGVNSVLQVSIRGIVGRLAVDVQLINAETGVHRRSDRLDIDLAVTTGARNEVTHRMAWTKFMALIKDINRQIETLAPEDWTPDDLVDRDYPAG
jgi:DNA-binding winged helix-turn-helix (wHTH) protein/TolB-like protein